MPGWPTYETRIAARPASHSQKRLCCLFRQSIHTKMVQKLCERRIQSMKPAQPPAFGFLGGGGSARRACRGVFFGTAPIKLEAPG